MKGSLVAGLYFLNIQYNFLTILSISFFIKIVSQNSEVQNLDSLIGGNKSEEAPEEDLVTSESKTGINIVMDYRLQEGPKYESKKDLLAALKSYFKRYTYC